MADDPLFITGKIVATDDDGSPLVHSGGSPVLIDGPNRWEHLLDLEFDPEFVEQMGLLNHYERLPLIVEWYTRGDLTPDELNRLLSDNWAHGGYAHYIGWDVPTWVEFFEFAGFVTDTPGAVRPQGPLVIWRGGPPGSERGLSWTTEKAVGEFFATRNVWREGAAELWRSTIDPEYVLGIFNGRNEAEVIIDPGQLGEILTVQTYTGEKSTEMQGWD